MANISAELAAIMAAIYGKDVRSSIHDAIDKINKVGEKAINAGTSINDGDPASGAYDKSLYINSSTHELLKCNGLIWQKISDLDGNGIDEITGPVTEGLVDIYTIHFTKTEETKEIQVTNGRSIDRIELQDTEDLEDTYIIYYNDDTMSTYVVTNGKDGVNGNRWFRSSTISGKVSNPTVYPDSGIESANENDINLNVNEGAIYHCVSGGSASEATWSYDFTLSGGGSAVWGNINGTLTDQTDLMEKFNLKADKTQILFDQLGSDFSIKTDLSNKKILWLSDEYVVSKMLADSFGELEQNDYESVRDYETGDWFMMNGADDPTGTRSSFLVEATKEISSGDTLSLGDSTESNCKDLEYRDIPDALKSLKTGGGISLLDVYPVGSIYMSVNNVSPAILFGGTWESLENRFLIGAGDTYTVGATGGSTSHTITTSEMPSHNHSFTGSSVNTSSISTANTGTENTTHVHLLANGTLALGAPTTLKGSGATSTAGEHSHQGRYEPKALASGNAENHYRGGATSHSETTLTVSAGNHTHTVTGVTGIPAVYDSAKSGYKQQTHSHPMSHTHSLTAAGTIGNTGSGSAIDITNPYLAVYMWKRTA